MKDKKVQQQNNLNIFLNEYFHLIALLIAIIIFLIAYVFLLGPKISMTKMAINNNIVAQKRLYGDQERRLNELMTVNKVYSEILPSDIGKFNQVLPSNYTKESLYGELEEIVVKHGFVLSSVTLEAEEEEDSRAKKPTIGSTQINSKNVGEIRIIASVQTIDYNGFKRLLKSIEASARLFDIESVTYSHADNTLDFELITYYYKSEVEEK